MIREKDKNSIKYFIREKKSRIAENIKKKQESE